MRFCVDKDFVHTMLRFIITFVILFIAVPHVASQQSESAAVVAQPHVDPDAYQIYAVLLAAQSEKFYVIRSEMTYGPDVTESGIKGAREFTKVWGTALADYVAKLHEKRMLNRDFPLDVPYKVVAPAEITELFKSSVENGWRAFGAQYPGARGYYWFSPVGFDKTKTHAILQMNNACGGLCGYGSPHFLEKTSGKWHEVTVKATFSVWAS